MMHGLYIAGPVDSPDVGQVLSRVRGATVSRADEDDRENALAVVGFEADVEVVVFCHYEHSDAVRSELAAARDELLKIPGVKVASFTEDDVHTF